MGRMKEIVTLLEEGYSDFEIAAEMSLPLSIIKALTKPVREEE